MYTRLIIIIFLLLIFTSSVLSNEHQSIGDTLILRSPNNQSDYLIISVDSFQSAIAPLQTYRQSQGLNVLFVHVNQIYTEFDDSLLNEKKIRHFISYTREYWQSPKPKYVLLLGDDDIIPTYKFQSYLISFGEDSVSIDEWFAINQYENDEILDIAIGRIPASSTRDVSIYSQKLIYFEDSVLVSDYVNDFMALSDTALVFENLSEMLLSSLSPSNLRLTRIDMRVSSQYYGTLANFINVINSGSLFLNYFGSGNEKIWSADTFFTYRDVNNLQNVGLPFVATTVCGLQKFDHLDDSTIVERLLFNSLGGAVATFAPTGIGYLNRTVNVDRDFYSYIISNPDSTLGTAIFSIKQDYPTNLSPDSEYRRMTFLGDPAMKLPSDFITTLNNIPVHRINEFQLYQNYPNPFNPITKIKFTLPEKSKVKLDVFNILGEKVATIVSNVLSRGEYSYTFDASGMPSGVYIYRLETDTYSETKKMMLIK